MKTAPLVSVLICNYNYAKHVKDALSSIKRQTYNNIEIIVIDDGSTDASVEVIEKFIKNNPEQRILLKAKKNNQGLCYGRNDALAHITGEYFLFLDSDDTIPDDYISVMYKTLVKQGADIVYGDVKAFDGEEYTTDYPAFSIPELFKRNYINISSLVKTASLGGNQFDLALNRKTHEDYDFWLGLALKGLKFVKSNNTYLNYRIQKSSRNANVLNMKERTREVVGIWKYSFSKYQALFPGKLTQDMIFDFYDHQLSMVGDELMALNDVVQKELVPELKRRDDHIQYLASKTIKQLIRERLKEIIRKT